MRQVRNRCGERAGERAVRFDRQQHAEHGRGDRQVCGSNFNDEAADFGAVTADGSEVGQGKVNTQNNTGATDYVLSLIGTWGG